jgi:DNA invertase Pin-like site-specific DNA recombinase
VKWCAYYYVPVSERPPTRSADRLRKAALASGYQVADGLGIAEQDAGLPEQRPGLRALLQAVRKGAVAAIVCSNIDDLGCSPLDLFNSVETIYAAGVRIIAVEPGLDIAGSPSQEGRFLCSALRAASRYERTRLSEKIRQGMADAQARGSRIGRPPGRAPDAGTVERLRKEGKTWDEIASVLGCSPTTVRRALTSRKKR